MFYLRSKISSLLLAVATAREAKPLNPSHDTSPYRFAFEFEVKFTNLRFQILLTETRTLKMLNLNLRIAQQLLTCSGVGVGGGLHRYASSCKQAGEGLFCSCEAKPKQRKATLYFSFTTFATVALRA